MKRFCSDCKHRKGGLFTGFVYRCRARPYPMTISYITGLEEYDYGHKHKPCLHFNEYGFCEKWEAK